MSEQTTRGDESPQTSGSGRALLGPRIMAIAILALGLVVAYQTVQLGREEGYSPGGPAFFPLIVSAGLLLFGILFLLQTTVRPDPVLRENVAEEEAATHWSTVGLIIAALLVYAFLIDPLGYPIATALFFVAVTVILGSRHWIRDIAIAVIASLALYFGFTLFLGVDLPGGVFELFL
jgi:putative tricarboxylic transport membrane protein